IGLLELEVKVERAGQPRSVIDAPAGVLRQDRRERRDRLSTALDGATACLSPARRTSIRARHRRAGSALRTERCAVDGGAREAWTELPVRARQHQREDRYLAFLRVDDEVESLFEQRPHHTRRV